MGKKLELVWEGYGFTGVGRLPDEPMTLDSDIEEVVNRMGMVHDMWREKENARFEDHRADVDCTPFAEDDLRVVEQAFRLAVLKAELAIKDRRDLHQKWCTARKFHWRHIEDIDAMWDADEAKHGEVDSPLGERIYNCECAMIARKVKKLDKRMGRLGRYVALIRHALYIRGQYRSGIEVAEWTGPQIRRMVLNFDLVPCECQDCCKSARDRVTKHERERDEGTKYLKRITKPYSLTQQLKDQAAREKKEKSTGFTVGGQPAVIFGQGTPLGFLFKK